MSKDLGEVINNIMEENAASKVLILTENLHIVGTIHDYYEKCKNCHECLVALKNVQITRIKELANCSEMECECHQEAFAHFDWFNISARAIVGFSIIPEHE